MYSRVLLCCMCCNALERMQRVCLNIILGKDYVEYIIALESCELEIHWSEEGTSFPSLLQRNASSSLPCCSSPTWTPTTSLGAVSCPCQSCQAQKNIENLPFHIYRDCWTNILSVLLLWMMITIRYYLNKSLFIYSFIYLCNKALCS